MASERPLPTPKLRGRHCGTSQGTRLLAALDPASAPVDPRSEADLLVWAARFSHAINFYNTQNRIEGDWAPFFESEPIVQYALVQVCHMESNGSWLHEQLDAWQPGSDVSSETSDLAEGNLLALLYDQCQRLNGWHRFFSQRTDERVFAGQVRAAIELTFSAALGTARRWEAGLVRSGSDILATLKLNNDLSSFDPALWRLGTTAPSGAPDESETSKKSDMKAVLVSAHAAEGGLVKAGCARLNVLLAAPAQLAPHFALFLAFLRQMTTHAQGRLNALTGEHLELFYRTIMEEKPAPPVPDQACVAFTLVPGTKRFSLPAGTNLVAKDAASTPVLYALAEPLDLSGCTIGQIATLMAWPFSPRAEDSQRLLARTMKAPPPSPWPMFGVEVDAAGRIPPGNAGDFDGLTGFAVSSPCLVLESGGRSITLTLDFQWDEQAPALKTGKATPAEVTDIGYAYSGATDWVSSVPGNIALSLKENGTRRMRAALVIQLGPEAPPCVGFNAAKLKGDFDAGSAVLKILLKNLVLTPGDSVQGSFLWLLGFASVERIKLDVVVSQAAPRSLSNDLGPIAPGSPILPFGSIPGQGSSFRIGCPEIAAKALTELTIQLTWQNLPLDPALYPEGLVSYYQAYEEAMLRMRAVTAPAPPGNLFARHAYSAALDYGAGQSWQALPHSLGDGEKDSGHLALFPVNDAKVTEWKFSYAMGSSASGMVLPVDGGSLRIQLVSPGYAFGHALYAQVMADIAMRNAQAMMTMAQNAVILPLPNPPLTPALSSVTVGYQASATISWTASDQPDRCYQILPFATRRLLAQNGAMPRLIERFDAGGYLHLGLVNVTPSQRISLLLVLRDMRAGSPEATAEDAPQWSVLCRSGWRSYAPGSPMLKDSTLGLLKSGCVQMVIPEDMDDQSALMPTGFCWLRVQVRNPACFPSVVQILPQAGVAVQVLGADDSNAVASPPVISRAAGSLSKLQKPDARVQTILQPLPSFGGRAAESVPEFHTRVSERLRHKGRAWTAWDHERLILQQHPDIFYARCLPHSPTPGHVRVIVLPRLTQMPSVLPPRFAPAELSKMQEWLHARMSPAVKLRVCNPRYETLKLTISVTFDASQPSVAAQAQLNHDLRQFISPWLYPPGPKDLPPFEFCLADIRDFIVARPYVGSLQKCAFNEATQGVVKGECVRPSHAWSLLITDEEHDITSAQTPS